MTVTFKIKPGMHPLSDMTEDFQNIVNEIMQVDESHKKFFYAQKKPVTKYPYEPWWITRIYLTTSETQPAKWFPYNSTTYTTGTNLAEGIADWCDYLGKKSDYTGYKIVTLCLDMLNGTSVVETAFCKEHFQVKEKVYINGPKKKPFPAKAAKHYQV